MRIVYCGKCTWEDVLVGDVVCDTKGWRRGPCFDIPCVVVKSSVDVGKACMLRLFQCT